MSINIYEQYLGLLSEWCDAMIKLQLGGTGRPEFDGGLMCPACKMIHGRCHDAIYPYVFLYRKTGRVKYLEAARRLFAWSDNLFTDEGSYYNDAQNDWEPITVFSVSSMARTLMHHEPVLPEDFRQQLKERLNITGEWVYQHITPAMASPINYQAAAAEALALCGTYLQRRDYLQAAEARARYCLDYFTDEGLFFGECSPRNLRSAKGCVGVDIGYNLEESLPALLEYAELTDDETVLRAVKMGFYTHQYFILPDGGVDNSFGTRNFKWTYWGSRTSDSFLHAFERMAELEQQPSFAEVKYHYYDLLRQCTADGLLYGGPDYHNHGEPPCVHHTMCKAKGLAQLLEAEYSPPDGRRNGAESPPPCGRQNGADLIVVEKRRVEDFHYQTPQKKSFPSIATEKYYFGGFIADVTAYDVDYCRHGHVSGSSLCLLWHAAAGPIFAASTMKHTLCEVTNTQLTTKKNSHRPLALRFEWSGEQGLYSTAYDYTAQFHSELTDNEICISGTACLADEHHKPSGNLVQMEYRIRRTEVSCLYQTKENGTLIIPLIADTNMGYDRSDKTIHVTSKRSSTIRLETEQEIESITPIFYLDGGFQAWEIVLLPDESGKAGFRLDIG